MPIHSTYRCQDIIKLFNGVFADTHNTRLLCALCDGRNGALDEPVYEPANTEHGYHQIVFAHGYFASALHEIAHWCLAGKARRLLEDFGYWYSPDGRSRELQIQFEKVEVKPQALEWLFSIASRRVFVASADNLAGEKGDDLAFRLLVSAQARSYFLNNLPPQAALLLSQLTLAYGGQVTLDQLYWPEESGSKNTL